MKTRSDRKFAVKIFLPHQNRFIFQNNCIKHHLSMMFVSNEFIKFALDNYSKEEIDNIIYSQGPKQKNNTKYLSNFSTKLTNEYWQKIGVHAINNGISISKAASCIFNHGLSTTDLYKIMEEHGLTFNYQKNITARSKYK